MEKTTHPHKVSTLFVVEQNGNKTEVEVEGSGLPTAQAILNEYPKARNINNTFLSGDKVIHLGFMVNGKFKEANQYPTTGKRYYDDTYYWYSQLNQNNNKRNKWQR